MALIVIMAQIGSLVPAKFASVRLVDKLFTRIGTSDSIETNSSSFMVEMQETAHIVNHATERWDPVTITCLIYNISGTVHFTLLASVFPCKHVIATHLCVTHSTSIMMQHGCKAADHHIVSSCIAAEKNMAAGNDIKGAPVW